MALRSVTVALLLLTTLSGNQRPSQPAFRTQVNLVEISAVVLDELGNPIRDLTAGDFDVREDGEPRALVAFGRTDAGLPGSIASATVASGASVERIATNKDVAAAPVFVILLDDLNTSPYNTHRAISAGLGVLKALPREALLAVLTTSGSNGTALTLALPSTDHAKRVQAFRGQLLLAGPAPNPHAPQTEASKVGAPCGVGSAVLNSQDCADPTRAERRARTVEAITKVLQSAGTRRKVLFWVTEDMGVSPLAPEATRKAQHAALRTALNAGVAVYPVDPRGLDAPFPGETVDRPGEGRPDRRAGNKLKTASTEIDLDTDDLVGVTLDQLARDSGGQWIRKTNNLDRVLGETVAHNTSAYLFAYESPNTQILGQHRIDVRVRRDGARVFARRGYVVTAETRVHAVAGDPSSASTLRALLENAIPQGQLAIRVQVVPMLGDTDQPRAVSLVYVDRATSLGRNVDVAVVTFDERGRPSNERTVRFTQGAPSDRWERSFDLQLGRGKHQLRVAAASEDGARTGLVVEDIVLPSVRGGLWMGPALMLDTLADSSPPTLGRVFEIGRPLHLQAEVAGREIADGSLQLAATLVNTRGAIVREGRPTLQRGTRRDRGWVSTVVETNGLPAGRYAFILGARAGANGSELNRSVLLDLTSLR